MLNTQKEVDNCCCVCYKCVYVNVHIGGLTYAKFKNY